MQPEATPHRSPVRRTTIIGLSLLAVAFAAAVIYDSSPPDVSEFLPESPPVADSENGFLLLQDVIAELKNRPDEERTKILELAKPGSTEWDAPLAEKILSDDKTALEALSGALEKPSWYHGKIDDTPNFSLIPDLVKLKKIAAVHAFESADRQLGIQHLRDLHTTADSISNANLAAIGELLQITIEAEITATIARIIPTLADHDSLKSIHELITANPPDRTSWRRGLHSEFLYFRKMLEPHGRQGSGLSIDGEFTILNSLAYKPNITLNKILAIYHESASNTEAPDFAARTTTLLEQVSEPPTGWRKYINLNSTGDEIAREASGSVHTVELKTWLPQVYHTQALLLVALQRYQLDHGNQLPASLSGLVPTYLSNLPSDPYNNSALNYDPERRLVWSVGQNLTDDGGHHDPEASRLDADNPTIHIPLPTTQ